MGRLPEVEAQQVCTTNQLGQQIEKRRLTTEFDCTEDCPNLHLPQIKGGTKRQGEGRGGKEEERKADRAGNLR